MGDYHAGTKNYTHRALTSVYNSLSGEISPIRKILKNNDKRKQQEELELEYELEAKEDLQCEIEDKRDEQERIRKIRYWQM